MALIAHILCEILQTGEVRRGTFWQFKSFFFLHSRYVFFPRPITRRQVRSFYQPTPQRTLRTGEKKAECSARKGKYVFFGGGFFWRTLMHASGTVITKGDRGGALSFPPSVFFFREKRKGPFFIPFCRCSLERAAAAEAEACFFRTQIILYCSNIALHFYKKREKLSPFKAVQAHFFMRATGAETFRRC